MKRELKLNFGELRLVEERVTEFEEALADIDAAAAYFDDVLGEQESEAVKALMERYRKMEKKILYFQDILGQLKTLLGNYIDDMESHIMPKEEDMLMLVDRNDIWWNMKQIEANISLAGDVASGRELSYYRDIDTTPSPPNIYEGMSPEAESAAMEGYRQNLRESQNRKENYKKLRNFCDGTAREARNSLNEFYDRLEELYKKHVVEFENTDDDYKRKAEEVYDACTGIGERFWDNAEKKVGFFLDIHKGTASAAVDFLSGILGLAFTLLKMSEALRVAVITMPFGITPQWVKDTGKEALEGARNIVQILKNPGRVLAAIGQQATDAVEEKGISYAVSYAAADITIGILVDKGIGKLKALGKTDDAAKLSTKADDIVDMADDLEAGVKAVEKMDDAAGMADDVVTLGNVESGLKALDTGELKVIEIKAPEVANSEWLARGYDKPPYNPSFEVKVVKAGNEKYVRVFSYNADGTSNKLGGWLMKKSDIEGLALAQIADKYALPKAPTHICDVDLSSDFNLQTGISNAVEGWGNGGGQQFDTMGKFIDEGAFVNERLIGD